jgi:hypothetical protein
MTGPEHYREAERLIAEATHWDRVPGTDPAHLTASAQVHATLAAAAATALRGSAEHGLPLHDWDAWQHAAGTRSAVTP